MLLALALLQITPANAFLEWMDATAQSQLKQRTAVIQSIRTKDQAEQRKAGVRAKILELLGGLPNYQGPLNPSVTGTIQANGYRIEKVMFDSLPRYRVTANLYVPAASGKYPAILFSMGHWDQGKPAAQLLAGNLARKGFVVLAYDPVGQGERLQAYDARLGRSLAGGSTDQHFMNGPTSIMIGQSFARYMIHDGMRGIDYLISRPEVDGTRIGATGCSGGGTQTTYIAALDPRVKAAAPACYMNSFQTNFKDSIGDSEQSFANFISSGFDQTDYVELFAPKPWLIGSTEDDFFRPIGAKIVYEEAREWYKIYGAEENVKWVMGPGGHGTPRKVREAIYEWMIRHLAGGKASPVEEDLPMRPDFDFRVTPGGNLTAAESRDIYEVIRDELNTAKKPGDIRDYLRKLIQQSEPAAPNPPAIQTRVHRPAATSMGTTAVLMLQSGTLDPNPRAKEILASGELLMTMIPRGLPVAAPNNYAADWITATRAWLIGMNLPALRARDIMAAAEKLLNEPGVTQVRIEASDTAGIWALLAASQMDKSKLAGVRIERVPHSIRQAYESPIHRGLHDVTMPNFAASFDLEDVVKLVGADKVEWWDPMDWMRNRVPVDRPWIRYSKFGH